MSLGRTQLGRLVKKRRKHLQQKKVDPKIARQVLSCFRSGHSITLEETRPHSIEDFLVELENAKYALHRVIECLDHEIEYEKQWLFVVGDYGTGKSQLKNQVLETIRSRESGYLVIAAANLQEDSLDDFCNKFIENLKQIIIEGHSETYQEFEPLFKQYSTLKSADKPRHLVKVIKKGINKGLLFFLQFDEMDQLANVEAFHPWASLLRSLSDQIRKGLLVIIYIAERELSSLWQRDGRLGTLDSFLADKLNPGSKFSSDYKEGIANIISLYEHAHKHRFHTESMRLIERFQSLHKERLEDLTLREFNIIVFLLCRNLQRFETVGLWNRIPEIKRKERSEQGQIAEKVLRTLINGIQFHFSFEGEKYSAELLRNRIIQPSWESDSKLRVLRKIENETVPYQELPIEVKHTTGTYHDANQIKYVQRMASSEPTVFFSIGPDQQGREKLDNQFKSLITAGQLVIIHIDRLLFQPIYLCDSELSPGLKTNLEDWLKGICPLRQVIMPFMEEIIRRNYRKQIEALKAEIQRIKVVSGPTPPSTERTPYFEVALVIAALFNKGSGIKRKQSLPKHVLDALNVKIDDFEKIYHDVLQELENRGFLKQTKASYKTTEKWSQTALDSFCQEMKNN